jgi:outer membrane cobalamin receptor
LKSALIIAFISVCFLSVGQLTEYELSEIKVGDSSKMIHTGRILTLRRSTILELQTEDAGQVLQKFAGVAIRSYGGLGGLKTISVRSLGSQHTSIVVDGFSLLNTQTGQINLGQIQSENIESIQLVTGSQKSYLVPGSSMVAGSSVSIESFENSFSTAKNQIRFTSKVGSFGQYDNYLSYKLSLQRFFISVFGKYRFANGAYPFVFENGQSSYEGIRTNNHYEDAQLGFSLGFRPNENGQFTISYKKENIDQQLPGAVILYSSTAFQTLITGADRVQADYVHHFKKISLRTFGAYHQMNLNYIDPSFLNSEGELNSIYRNDIAQFGINMRLNLSEKVNLFAAVEEQWSTLKTNMNGFGIPERFHTFIVVGTNYDLSLLKICAQISTQIIQEKMDTIVRDAVNKFNPFVQLESKEFAGKWKLTGNVFYRNSFRMPSFNELYYNNIGNSSLKPENADQLSGGLMLSPKFKRWSIVARTNVYFNQVRDKIVAIPTKNLFVWSMQNVGKVNIIGCELSADLNYTISKNWSIAWFMNFTFQSAKDITDRDEPTFDHQIAYIPKYSGNLDLTLQRKQTGIRISNFANSLRYSLNENIPSNEVNGFWVTDCSLFTRLPIKKHDIRLQLSCKNIFNSSYALVRYYVMPGRNYLISLNYAFK